MFINQSDHEKINELEKECNIEQEQEWNKQHPLWSWPTSSLSMHNNSTEYLECSRIQSHPTHPGSAISHLMPDFHQHHPFNNLGTSSPTSSIRSPDSEKEHALKIKHKINHQRKHNWNSPHPKWDSNTPHRYGQSVPPLPPSLSPPIAASHTLSQTTPKPNPTQALLQHLLLTFHHAVGLPATTPDIPSCCCAASQYFKHQLALHRSILGSTSLQYSFISSEKCISLNFWLVIYLSISSCTWYEESE